MSNLGDKKSFKISPTVQWREREPTSPEIANRGLPRMSIDFSRQDAVVPKSLGQTTRYGENDGQFRTMNDTGRPKALNTMNGGGPDVRARRFNEGEQRLTDIKGR